MPHCVRIEAPSRLHFGLLSFGQAKGRQYGGIGLMVERPGIVLQAEAADRLRVSGLQAQRVREFADRWQRSAAAAHATPRCHLRLLQTAPEHVGLGTGTQLALSVAAALYRMADQPIPEATTLADSVQRGLRSSIGTHGFLQGGLVFDRGKSAGESLGLLGARLEMPSTWRVVQICPIQGSGLSGAAEQNVFRKLPPCRLRRRSGCCGSSSKKSCRQLERQIASDSAKQFTSTVTKPACVSPPTKGDLLRDPNWRRGSRLCGNARSVASDKPAGGPHSLRSRRVPSWQMSWWSGLGANFRKPMTLSFASARLPTTERAARWMRARPHAATRDMFPNGKLPRYPFAHVGPLSYDVVLTETTQVGGKGGGMARKGAEFAGLSVALITPFKDGQVDVAALRQQVQFQIDAGTKCLCPVGTTGESPTLTHEEHERVISEVVQAVAGRVKVMPGTGSNSTAEALRLTKWAAREGADAALMVAPYYNKPTQEGFYQHYKAVAEAVDIPLCVYNIPGRTGKNVEPETIARMADIENITMVKEATGSMDQASQVLATTDLTVLSGDDSMTLPLLAVGGEGVISVVGNIVPADMIALLQAFNDGNLPLAQKWHTRLFMLCRDLLSLATNPIPIKAAMQMLGRDTGELRLPMTPLDEAGQAKLRQTLAGYGML